MLWRSLATVEVLRQPWRRQLTLMMILAARAQTSRPERSAMVRQNYEHEQLDGGRAAMMNFTGGVEPSRRQEKGEREEMVTGVA
jgi:hypothetical protein